MSPRPPTWARTLLALVLRGDAGNAFRGDLDERFVRRCGRDGPRAARRWYRRQIVSVMIWTVRDRVGAWIVRPDRPPAHRTTGHLWPRNRREYVRQTLSSLHVSARTLRKSPSFAVPAVLLIALGVGGFTTVFTLVDHTLLRPLPYPDADRLVRVGRGSHSGPVARALQEETRAFDAWAVSFSDGTTLESGERPVQVETASVSEGFFSLFGGVPEHGRLLVAEDFVAADAVVLSAEAWRRFYGGDPGVVGRTVRLDGRTYTIAGILDSGFRSPRAVLPEQVDVWRPIDWSDPRYQRPDMAWMRPVGRIAPGVELDAATADLDALAEVLAARYPENMRDANGVTEPLPMVRLRDATVQRVRGGLGLLFGGVVLLLGVACLNVAHLFLARSVARLREMAVRRALGADRRELLRQVVMESLIVGVTGGAVGIGLAMGALDALLTLRPPEMMLGPDPTIDVRIVAFAMLVSTGTAVLFGVLPGLGSVRSTLAGDMRNAGRGGTGTRSERTFHRGMVVAEVGLSVVLVALTGVLLRGYQELHDVSPGFDTSDVWTLPLSPTPSASPLEFHEMMDGIVTSLENVPGVASATYSIHMPFEQTGAGRCCWRNWGMVADGRARDDVSVIQQPIHRSYFTTLRVPLVAGDVWERTPPGTSPVPVVLTERLAIDFFGSAARALGRPVVWERGRMEMTVVGVAGDTRHYGLDQPVPTMMYLPSWTAGYGFGRAHLAVRAAASADPAGFPNALREAVWDAVPTLPVPIVRPMDDWISISTDGRRFNSIVFGAFGAASLLLACAGLYGTLLYHVRQQRRVMGIRVALGATPGRLERATLMDGLRLGLAGCLIGAVAAWMSARLLAARLPDIARVDPAALSAAAILLLATAALASWLPARRAGRTDPMETLNAE